MKLLLLLPVACFALSWCASSLSAVDGAAADDRRSTYVVHMDPSAMPGTFAGGSSSTERWYNSVLESLASPEDGEAMSPPELLYAYSNVMHGFSAALTPAQLEKLRRSTPGFVDAHEESFGRFHTTNSPAFLGLSREFGLWPASNFGEGMVIGMIDTGIWPERDSFADKGMPSPPATWKGRCETGQDFDSSLCNQKLIGARSFSRGIRRQGFNISGSDYDSPRDFFGHGTHTSSTAAGSSVPDADYFGYAGGTATGVAPKAHIAMYKVLFDNLEEYATSDVLAGMEKAIEDGVDLMSLSLGFYKVPFYEDALAIAAFAAMEKGIFVTFSAGNSGPHAYTCINNAPWLTAVGASTIDRDYYATITVGDGEETIRGRSIYPERIDVSNFTLYYGVGNHSKATCEYLSLDPSEVEGKVVFCDLPGVGDAIGTQILEVNRTGAEAAILVSDVAGTLSTKDFGFPFVAVSVEQGKMMSKYARGAGAAATVSITFIETELGVKPAPQVAAFSSRGPSLVSTAVLKPDIIAPGVNILAAWVPNKGFTPEGHDYLITDYALASGTSMSAPHVTGIAAMIKSVHPDWSPAAIRSAMMTTADIVDNTGHTFLDMDSGTAATPLDFGAGHMNPNKAVDPGCVYDIAADDYVDFLCALNYTARQIHVVTKRAGYNCENATLDLNYPSFIVILAQGANVTGTTFKRVLTSVHDGPTRYRSAVTAPPGMKVAVEPSELSFAGRNARQEFKVRVDVDLADGPPPVREYVGNYGYLSWNEIGGSHVVRSPIVSAFAP